MVVTWGISGSGLGLVKEKLGGEAGHNFGGLNQNWLGGLSRKLGLGWLGAGQTKLGHGPRLQQGAMKAFVVVAV